MANFPKVCTNKPLVALTLEALWISVFSFSQLKKDSISCLTLDTACENKSLAALSLCLSTSVSLLISLCGVSTLTGYSHWRKKSRCKPKSVIRISRCCMAMRSLLISPRWTGKTALFLKPLSDRGYACPSFVRITARFIQNLISMDGNDGEGRMMRTSPVGKIKPLKSLVRTFQRLQLILEGHLSNISLPVYNMFVGKCFWIYRRIQCLKFEHMAYAQSMICFDMIYLIVCSFYFVASCLYKFPITWQN